MRYQFEPYTNRKIEYLKNVSVNDCKIKIYTITNRGGFESKKILENSINKLPFWISDIQNSSLQTYNCAFLIVHEAREGVLILLCWWTRENMLETKIYFADFDNPSEINLSIYNPKQLVCIWELQIYAHERKAWIEHVLSHPNSPKFEIYMNDYLIQ
ncbi:MAG: hypothetical protein L3J14_09020 [Flavobacteriaceae bacterium]|nr:hypothetical protein [Flavobacteriaceae bacterium]